MMTTTLTWHDARTESPKTAGPFLCVSTEGKIKTEKYFAKAKYPQWENNEFTVILWADVELPTLPNETEMNDWRQTGGQKQWDAYLKTKQWNDYLKGKNEIRKNKSSCDRQ